jgi:rhamnulokinase
MAVQHVVAVDLGAGSGRVMDVQFDGTRLELNQLYRFSNYPVQVTNTLYWDVLNMWKHIQTGLSKRPKDVLSIGVDTWGADIAMLDKNGQLLANPVHYRDADRADAVDWVLERIPRREVYDRTGIQFMPFNTLYLLGAWLRCDSPLLDAADTMLAMPDLFHYWLTGEKYNEFTYATTTQMFSPTLKDWDREMLNKIGIPTHFFPPTIRAGDRIGEYEGIPVIAPPAHDTASAVVAVPTVTSDYAYLSSGTWSLLGLELQEAIINEASFEANITNEGGYNNTYRLLKNIMGLWIMEQSLATWRDMGKDYTYAQFQQMASAQKQPFRSLIDPDELRFYPPGNMPDRIQEFCKETKQPVPETDAEIMTAILVSMALKYRHAVEQLEAISGQSIRQLHIIGGGSQNHVLNQMTANAIGRPVYAGPSEATTLGNAIVQLITLGELASLEEARTMLYETTGVILFEPKDVVVWNENYQRFQDLIQ